MLLVSACAPRPREISRIALLAPFEGRYREVGYNALYAAKLALQDTYSSIELLPVDDGGTVASAADRAHALAGDPLVKAVVVLGYAATDAETQRAFGSLPVLVVGSWGAKPETNNILVLSNPLVDEMVTMYSRAAVTEAARAEAPLIGGEVFALEQFTRLRPSLEGIKVVSSGSLPDAAFSEQYAQAGLYVPAPGLLATLTYDAFGWLISALQSSNTDVMTTLTTTPYNGINGTIRFEQGYWVDAPVHQYVFDSICLRRGGKMCLVAADTATP